MSAAELPALVVLGSAGEERLRLPALPSANGAPASAELANPVRANARSLSGSTRHEPLVAMGLGIGQRPSSSESAGARNGGVSDQLSGSASVTSPAPKRQLSPVQERGVVSPTFMHMPTSRSGMPGRTSPSSYASATFPSMAGRMSPMARSPVPISHAGTAVDFMRRKSPEHISAGTANAAAFMAMSGYTAGDAWLPEGKLPPGAQVKRYTWDGEFEQMLRPKVAESGLIGALSSNPPSADLPTEPDSQALAWFRERYPEPPPTHRHDVLVVQQWLEHQMHELKKSMEQQQLMQTSPRAAVRNAAPRSSSPTHGQPPQGLGNTANGGPKSISPMPGAAPASGTQPPVPGAFSPSGLGCYVPDALLSIRDSEGFLNTPVLLHQETLFTKSLEELIGQVAAVCVERGYLLFQLWTSMRRMFKAMLQDREVARGIMRDARRAEVRATEAMHAKEAQMQTEKDEVERMNELLNRRLLNAKADLDNYKEKCKELEIRLSELADIHPEVLQEQIADLKAQLQAAEKQVLATNIRLEQANRELGDRDREISYLNGKLQELKTEASHMSAELTVRTPRPSQARQPPWELLSQEECDQAQQALREGCSSADMHRLLLGVSFTSANLLPWFELLGCCRHWNPTAKPDEQQPGGPGDEHEAEAAAAHTRNPPRSQKSMSQSAFAAAIASANASNGELAPPTAGGLSRATSLAPPRSAAPAGNKSRGRKSHGPVLASIKELHPVLRDLVAKQNVSALQRCLPESVVEAVSQMTNHGVDADSVACLLLGTLSPDGFEVTPYRSLAGILSTRFNGSADDLGGPITEALQLASLSTRERVEHLEKTVLKEHRQTVKLRRALVEQRKQLDDAKVAEAKQQARKVPRKPHPLKTIIQSKRAEYFNGLGTDPSVPVVLQVEGRVYNRAMEKADAERMIHHIWRGKRDFEQQNNVAITLADYLYLYMHRKHGQAKAVAEGAYNLLYALGQHSYDPDCALFLLVFMGELDEAVRGEQEALKASVISLFKELDVQLNSRQTGWLLKADMRKGLRDLFKSKPDAQMEEMFHALDSDEPKEMVNYFRLFDDDSDLNQGVFAETIRQQHLNERLDFFQVVEDSILDQVEKSGSDSCTVAMLVTALRKEQPQLTQEQMDEYISRVFGEQNDSSKKGKKGPGVPLDTALSLLRTQHRPNLCSAQEGLDLMTKSASAGLKSPTKDPKGGRRTLIWDAQDAPTAAAEGEA